MQKQKRWQFALILAVTALTVYNILPTVFFYTKPLDSPVNEARGNQISIDVVNRINSLEEQSIEWIQSFCRLLQLKPQSVQIDSQDPQLINISFQNSTQAKTFRAYLPRAGALIPFTPSQLNLYGEEYETEGKTVKIQRKIPVHFDPSLINSFFQFSSKFTDQGQPAPLYQALVKDRVAQIVLSLGGISQNTQYVQALLGANDPVLSQELASSLANSLNSFSQSFGTTSEIAKRYFSSFTLVEQGDKSQLAQKFVEKLEEVHSGVLSQIHSLSQEEDSLKGQGKYLDSSQIQLKQLLINKANQLQSAIFIVKNSMPSFSNGPFPLNYSNLGSLFTTNSDLLRLEGRNPFIESVLIDWRNEAIYLNLHKDIDQLKTSLSSQDPRRLQKVEQFLFNELALLTRQTEENLVPSNNGYKIALSELPNSKSFLAFRLASIAQAQVSDIKSLVSSSWKPKHPDLQSNVFPILDYETYLSLPVDQKTISLVVYAPVTQTKVPETGFRMNSVYVIAKGVDRIMKKLEEDPSSEHSQMFMQDFYKLKGLLQKSGYMGYEGSLLNISKEFAGDFIFESPDYFKNVLAASRENFTVKGTQRYAVLEFSNVEQRILTENKIDTRIHEDLLKWKDDYTAAQLSLKGASKYDVPKPTQNVLLSNLKLSFVKYFRGDDRKILHWGLDLSGGKTIQIELRDSNNRVVTNEIDVKQGMNELYSRVNKMGVSEVSLRQEGHLITLDFPGSQNLSASELVKSIIHVLSCGQ